jgi:hypothetical protein
MFDWITIAYDWYWHTFVDDGRVPNLYIVVRG